MLNKIGFKAKLKLLAHARLLETIGNQATKAQIGFADWFQDYPHPLDWFDVLLNGNRITETHNNNFGNFDVRGQHEDRGAQEGARRSRRR